MAKAKKTKVVEEIQPVEKTAEELKAEALVARQALRDKVITEIDKVLGQLSDDPELLFKTVNDTAYIFMQFLYKHKGPSFLPTMVGHVVKVCQDMTNISLKGDDNHAGK